MPAPKGNKNASRKNREYRNALLRSLKQYQSETVARGQALRKVTDKLVELAIQGEPWAVKEIANRIDGRSPAAFEPAGFSHQPIVLLWDTENAKHD